MAKEFGLIGKSLKHSFSPKIHAMLGKYSYGLYELEPENLESFVKAGKLCGYNVTIPYKKDVMKYLDVIDERAKRIGAVNTVVEKNGKKIGFNTDFDGMLYMLSYAGISVKNKNVMILGSGGTSNTASAVCAFAGAKKISTVSRSGELNYDNCYEKTDTEIIINATPVGMYPNNYQSPVDLARFKNLSGVADVIYNPNMTELTFRAKELEIPFVNGLPMLVAQAKYAAEKFWDKAISDEIIESVLEKLYKENSNVVLIGMPGAGKSTVGKKTAAALGKDFIDTDEEIVKREGMSVSEIFKEKGEEYFRKVESEVLKSVCKLTGKVIATGGGVVKNPQNRFPLKSNGKVFWIKRNIESLPTEGRPLSKDIEAVRKLYEERKDMYAAFADCVVINDSGVDDAVKGVIEKL